MEEILLKSMLWNLEEIFICFFQFSVFSEIRNFQNFIYTPLRLEGQNRKKGQKDKIYGSSYIRRGLEGQNI